MKKIIVFLSFFITGLANAGVILQADSIWSDGPAYSEPTGNIINQSGLSNTYTNGVDDFTSFVSSTTANYYNGTYNDLGSNSAQLDNFYFDLGDIFTIDALAIWNQTGSASLKTFDIYSSTDSAFTDTTLLGSYSIADGQYGAAMGNILSFEEATAQYFMIDVTANYGYSYMTKINEVAFSSIETEPVPEPSMILLLILSLTGLVVAIKNR